jgi:hypothetical protein
VASEQSPGGQRVWEYLQKHHPDVNVHGWLNGKPVNINMSDPEYSHAPEHTEYQQYLPKNQQSKETSDAYNMKLVATKK